MIICVMARPAPIASISPRDHRLSIPPKLLLNHRDTNAVEEGIPSQPRVTGGLFGFWVGRHLR